MNTIFILNRDEEIIAVLSGDCDTSGCHFFNSKLTLEINKGASLTFGIDTNETAVVQHVKEENMVVVHDGEDYRLLIIKEVVDVHEDDYNKEVYCEDASIELIDEIILNEVQGKIEMGDVLSTILENTRWGIGEVDNTYIRNLKPNFKLKTVLNGIQELASQYDAEIDFTVEFAGNKIVSRKVHMKKTFGRTLGKRFEFGKDVTSIKRTVNTSDIKTAIIPFGATNEETGEVLTIEGVEWTKPDKPFNKPLGQTYLEDEEATELWGYKGNNEKRRAKWVAITFEECTNVNELINYAQLQLNRFNKPKITYEASVIDLYRMTADDSYSFEKVGLGDMVNIIDHEFVPALALTSRVVKLELDLNDSSNTSVTLGTIIESIVDKDLKTQIEELNIKVGAVASSVDLSDIEDRLDKVESETGTGRWEQIQEVNNLLFGNSVGYHYMSEDNGIWIFDKPANQHPTKAVALKGGMIGLAKYDEQKQKWNVGTFIDGNQVNASMITTGTLKADRIEAGALTVAHFNQELKTVINSVGDKPSREEVKTSIQTAVDSINLSVSEKYETKTDVTNKINDAKENIINTASQDSSNKVANVKNELNNKIDGMEIGVRNSLRNGLLKGISFPYSGSEYNWRTASINEGNGLTRTKVEINDCNAFLKTINGVKITNSSNDNVNGDIAQDNVKMEHDRVYTMSAYFKLTKGNAKGALQYGTSPYFSQKFTLTNVWKRYSFTFTYNKSEFKDKLTTNIYFGIRGANFEGYMCGFKLEKGIKATDYIDAIEDTDASFDGIYDHVSTVQQSVVNSYESALEVAKKNITLSVSEMYAKKDDVSAIEQSLSSKIDQTAKDISLIFNKSTDAVKDDLQGFKDQITSYIRFDANGMELGKQGSKFKTRLTNEKLAFLQDEEEVAYISNNKMNITDAEIKNQLTLGSYAFVPRSNGNLSLKWTK